MNRSVLLRLLPASRTGARLAGVMEEVDTGAITSFRDAADLVALLQRVQGASSDHRPELPGDAEPDQGSRPSV